MPAAAGALNPSQAKNTIVRAYIPVTGASTLTATTDVTNSGSAVTVTTQGTWEDVTMTLASDPGISIPAGNYLRFVDSSGNQYIAKVRTAFTSGTSLLLRAPETIPADAVASFPSQWMIRQSADLQEDVATNTFSSFDHSQATVSIGEGTGTITLNGGFSTFDPGILTAQYAKDNSLKMIVSLEYEPDNATQSTGFTQWAQGVITSIAMPATEGDALLANVTMAVQEVTRVEATT